MSDLWATASADVETETFTRHLTAARVESAALWPFLAAAVDEGDYANRKALSAERIEAIAANQAGDDAVVFTQVHAGLLSEFDRDFAVLHGQRVAARVQAEVVRRSEQAVRDRIVAETMRRQAGGLENLGDNKAKPFGAKDGGEDGDEMPDFIKKKIEDKEARLPTGAPGAPDQERSEDEDGPHAGDTVIYQGLEGEPQQSPWWEKDAARKTASTYCPNHGVYVGEGNSEQHNECKTEQRESKDSTRKVAYTPHKWVDSDGHSACIVCGIPEEEAIPLNGPMIGCGEDTRPYHDPMDEPLSQYASKTAGENPFATKKPADDSDAGAPDATADNASDQSTWTCPNCQGTDAYTQGGKELAEALKASEPIKCGSCQQVDSSGGQQDPAAATPAPGQPATPTTPPAPKAASRHPFVRGLATQADFHAVETFDVEMDPTRGASDVSQCPDCNVTGNAEALAAHRKADHTPVTQESIEQIADAIERGLNRHITDRGKVERTSAKTAANPYEPVGNPYTNDPPVQPGTPDDLLDGPRDVNPLTTMQAPVTTRPRQTPSGAPSEQNGGGAPYGIQQGFASLATLQRRAAQSDLGKIECPNCRGEGCSRCGGTGVVLDDDKKET